MMGTPIPASHQLSKPGDARMQLSLVPGSGAIMQPRGKCGRQGAIRVQAGPEGLITARLNQVAV